MVHGFQLATKSSLGITPSCYGYLDVSFRDSVRNVNNEYLGTSSYTIKICNQPLCEFDELQCSNCKPNCLLPERHKTGQPVDRQTDDRDDSKLREFASVSKENVIMMEGGFLLSETPTELKCESLLGIYMGSYLVYAAIRNICKLLRRKLVEHELTLILMLSNTFTVGYIIKIVQSWKCVYSFHFWAFKL